MTPVRNDTVASRCDEHELTLRYEGSGSWSVFAPEPLWSGTNDGVARTVRRLLGLEGEVPYSSAIVHFASTTTRGTIKNNTFPTHVWFYDLDPGGWAGVAESLEAAIWSSLQALRLAPSAPAAGNSTSSLGEFDVKTLVEAIDVTEWANRLEVALLQRITESTTGVAVVSAVVEELERGGHRLYCFDESDDFVIWCHDWTDGRPGPQLLLEFHLPAYEPASVSVTVRVPESPEAPGDP